MLEVIEDHECWRPVPGWDAYEVSDQGAIRRVRGGRGQRRPVPYLLSRTVGSHGYWQVNLCQNGRPVTRTVHSLVAEAFLGPCPLGMEVDHRNGDRLNCRLANLRYLTPAKNQEAMGARTLYAAQIEGARRLSDEAVREIRQRCAAGERQRAVAAAFGVTQPQVSKIVTGKRWGGR